MIRIDIDRLAQLLDRLEDVLHGEVAILCRGNVPVAEIHPVPARAIRPRPIGLAKDKLSIPRSFFDSLPESVLGDFAAAPPLNREKGSGPFSGRGKGS
jgi:antitoxin (DNA-binding transcriptional repressor) of toxin-antitoxin stability system